MAHRQIAGRLVIATHNPGKLAEMRDLLAVYGVDAISAGELGLRRAGGNRHHVPRQRPDQGARPPRRRANMPAFADNSGLVVDALDGEPGIHSARWAGPDKDFRFAMNKIQSLLIERGAKSAERRRGAFRLGAVRRLAGRPCRGVRGDGGRHRGLAAARQPGLRLRSAVPARRPDAAPSARCRARKSTACRRTAAGCRIAPAPSSSSRRRVLASADATSSAFTCTGRSACRSARIATSTATSAMPRSTSRASCAPSKPRSPRPRRASRAAPCRASSSAAARHR